MIIAIGGRMGSGKNTVCDIIQDLCKKHNGPSFEQKAFAGKLKQTASLLTGISVEKFEDQEFKMINLSDDWSSLQQSGRSKVLLPMTVRTFLQKLGTEAMREGLHTNVWVNALFADYKDVYIGDWGQGNHMYEKPKWIITDMRFPNELEAIVERKGITIRVVRGCSECGGIGYHKMSCSKQYEKQHPSETALDDAEFDYEIINDGTIEDLVEKVREILIKENII